MTKVAIEQINKAFKTMLDRSQAFQSKNIIKESRQFLATVNPADDDTVNKTLLGTIALVHFYEGRGVITKDALDELVPPVTGSLSEPIAETMKMEKRRHQKLVQMLGESCLKKEREFECDALCREFPDVQAVLREINYTINPQAFDTDFANLSRQFNNSISTYTKLLGNQLKPAQSQFRESLVQLRDAVLNRCKRVGDPLYTLTNGKIIADNVDALAKKVGATKFTQKDINDFTTAMAPFAATSEWIAMLVNSLLIALGGMLVGAAVGAIPGMVIGASVGTVSACIYGMWATPETLPVDAVEDSAKTLFVK